MEKLAGWFIGARQALGAAEPLCSRANQLVESGRANVEKGLSEISLGAFILLSLDDQVQKLYGLSSVYRSLEFDGKDKLEIVESQILVSETKIHQALDNLGKVKVNFGIDKQQQQQPALGLRDYIEEAGLAELESKIESDVKQLYSARVDIEGGSAVLGRDITLFTNEIKTFADRLSLKISCTAILDQQGSSSSNSSTNIPRSKHIQGILQNQDIFSIFPPPLVANIYTNMSQLEDHGHEMANLLESLAQHFDKCSDILHANNSSSGSTPLTIENSVQQQQQQQQQDQARRQPADHPSQILGMTSAEYQKLLQVVDTDAQEVPSVMAELRDRLQEMESLKKILEDSVQEVVGLRSQVQDLFTRVDEYGAATPDAQLITTTNKDKDKDLKGKLKDHVSNIQIFCQVQGDLLSEISMYLSELDGLCGYYNLFIQSYYALIIELDRRQHNDEEMNKTVNNMNDKLQQLSNQEQRNRFQFLQHYGEFLPSDLIPPKIQDRHAVKRYKVVKIKDDDNNNNDDDGEDSNNSTMDPALVETARRFLANSGHE